MLLMRIRRCAYDKSPIFKTLPSCTLVMMAAVCHFHRNSRLSESIRAINVAITVAAVILTWEHLHLLWEKKQISIAE